MNQKYAFINGRYLPIDQVKINVTDVAVLRGYAAFDSLAAVGDTVVDADEHLQRFRNSLRLLGLRCRYSNQEIKAILKKLLNKNNFQQSQVKIIVTGGEIVNSLEFDASKSNFFILVTKSPKVNGTIFNHGIKLITAEHQRELAEAKTINYITAVRLQKRRQQHQAFEILYKSNGKVLECTTSNFFIVKSGKVITPKENVLHGITRSHVLKLAKKYYTVQERDISVSELKRADEAFITATYKDIIPVVKIDGFKIGAGKVGEVTKKLMKEYTKVFGSSK